MELKTEVLKTENRRGTAAAQVTFDEIYNLPDYLPDFHSVILSRGEVRIDESKSGSGHIMVKGAVNFKVLYRTGQNDWKVSSLEGNFPFQETLAMDSVDEFDTPQVEIVLEDLTVQMMNARRLNLRALMEIRASAWERVDLQLPVGLETEAVPEIRKEEQTFLELVYRGREKCRIHEEVKLPANKPNIRQILWQQAQIFGVDSRVSEGKLTIQGEIQIFVVYLGGEEEMLQWFETKVPYQCSFQITEADLDVIPYIIARAQDFRCTAQPDADGEERVILAEADLLADIWLYREQAKELIRDMYALDKKLTLKEDAVQIPCLHMKNESKCRVTDTIRLPDTGNEILQICAGFGETGVDSTEITENGIAVEGTVRVQVLSLTGNDNSPIEAAEGMIPFRYVMEVPGIGAEETFELQHSLDLLSFMMKGNKELEVQAVVSLQALVTKPVRLDLIKEVGEEPLDMSELNSQPGMVGLTMTAGDSLWEIAKRYHTTQEAILKTNQLEGKAVKAGTRLLLIKKITIKD